MCLLSKKCDEVIQDTGGNTATLEFILNNPGEWDVLPHTGQVMMYVKKHLILSTHMEVLMTCWTMKRSRLRLKYAMNFLNFLENSIQDGIIILQFFIMRLPKPCMHLVRVRVKHCNYAAEMCEGEEGGSMYDQHKHSKKQ